MTNLTKIKKPFGLLDKETQDALRQWPHGWDIYYADGWDRIRSPTWTVHMTYRACPEPLTPDTIDWSHVAPEWKFMARDKNGLVCLHNIKPIRCVSVSWVGKDYANVAAFASYRRGTIDWQYSLVVRPEGV